MDRRHFLGSLAAAVASIAVAARSLRLRAQDAATPAASPAATPVAIVTAVLMDTDQQRLGTATLTEGAEGAVTVNLNLDPGALPPGQYGLSLHETGICQPADEVPFASAGGVMSAAGESGTIGELTVEQDTATMFATTVDGIALDDLSDRDGTALVIHAGEDEPARVSCGIVYPPAEIATAATTPAATPEAEATPESATPEAAPDAAAEEVTVEMVDIDFNPNEFTIPANTDVTVNLPNLGEIVHNFNIDPLDIHSEDVDPGGETSVTINAEPGDYEYYCSIPGHREAGMVGTVHVEE